MLQLKREKRDFPQRRDASLQRPAYSMPNSMRPIERNAQCFLQFVRSTQVGTKNPERQDSCAKITDNVPPKSFFRLPKVPRVKAAASAVQASGADIRRVPHVNLTTFLFVPRRSNISPLFCAVAPPHHFTVSALVRSGNHPTRMYPRRGNT